MHYTKGGTLVMGGLQVLRDPNTPLSLCTFLMKHAWDRCNNMFRHYSQPAGGKKNMLNTISPRFISQPLQKRVARVFTEKPENGLKNRVGAQCLDACSTQKWTAGDPEGLKSDWGASRKEESNPFFFFFFYKTFSSLAGSGTLAAPCMFLPLSPCLLCVCACVVFFFFFFFFSSLSSFFPHTQLSRVSSSPFFCCKSCKSCHTKASILQRRRRPRSGLFSPPRRAD